jgi:hypothetical protein
MRRAHRWFAPAGLALVALLALAACGSTPLAGPSSSPAATPAASATPAAASTASPQAVATPAAGYATAQQAADAGARASGAVACATQYPGQQNLLVDSVGVFTYDTGSCGGGGHAGMFVWVYRDAGGWHPYTWASTQVANMPTAGWGAQIPMQTGGGCVNARAQPSLSAAVVSCLGASNTVIPAGSNHTPWYPPVWAGGYVWWYVFQPTGGVGSSSEGTPLGWVVLDYLVCGTGPRNLNLACGS